MSEDRRPVPAADRCREPRRHRTADTERCPVCADQVPLFDLEEVAGR